MRRKLWIVAAVVMCLTLSSHAATQVATLKIEPADVDRIDAPMCVKTGTDLPDGSYYMLPEGTSGGPIAAQLERAGKLTTLYWIEQKIEAGKGKAYAVFRDEPKASEAFAFKAGDGTRDLLYGEKPVWRDMIKYDPADRANTFKPFKHVYGLNADDGFITHGPGGLYTHHRGIFFGFKTQYGDFWHCPDVTQRHAKYLDDREIVGPVVARDASVTDWVAKDEKTVARDTREVTTWRVSPTDVAIDFRITVEALTDDPLQLGGDAHHAGFHFRAAQSVAGTKPNGSDGTATYIRPEASTLTKNDIWEKEDWAHVMFPINRHSYAVTHFDAPTNFRPIQYSTRPYGRVGSFFITTVSKDKPLVLRYRIRVRDGEKKLTEAELAREYKDYATPVTASVELVK